MKRKLTIRAILLTFGCALAMAGVAWLSEHPAQPRQSTTVFAGPSPMELNDDNLVDALDPLQLPLPIAKVELNRNILSIDLKVEGDRMSTVEVYRGMAEMISFAFEHTSNIDQLLLRMMAEDRWLGTQYLLLAADVRRSEFSAEELNALRHAGSGELPEALRLRMRVTETRLWKSRFLEE
ncbi:hypothetical protein M0651_03980 [Paenibacillus sp. MBLB2552]|uniref:Uncharacterized protein n=1 Tax=Paenibacillus mellifer TaxID=2937794 RepID=A0A9X1XVX4_9BACL|nr:hypothetical protein [Paenibacillus mellifer]MCK8486329.1 hypothetical protein [Paenibacillus mellifer]